MIPAFYSKSQLFLFFHYQPVNIFEFLDNLTLSPVWAIQISWYSYAYAGSAIASSAPATGEDWSESRRAEMLWHLQ
ncbi:hypothetical protein D770_15805 [Flammeovirgaceae bacterium 311]|nr:hypothetical protein D770_15805 [Flammeovirgaceae bacterium 311]